MEHIAKLQPSFSVKLVNSASINSDLPELGTPVTMASSPGTTCVVRRLFCRNYATIVRLQINDASHFKDEKHLRR